jgi:hypothetical protein
MLLSFVLSSLLCLSTVSALPNPNLAERAACDCSGTRDGGRSSKDYICRDARLGPTKLPRKLPLSTFVESYNRFGGLTPIQFLQTWTDEKGSYKYPPQNGFQLDEHGNAINGSMILPVGTLVDRFGSEYGKRIIPLIISVSLTRCQDLSSLLLPLPTRRELSHLQTWLQTLILQTFPTTTMSTGSSNH